MVVWVRSVGSRGVTVGGRGPCRVVGMGGWREGYRYVVLAHPIFAPGAVWLRGVGAPCSQGRMRR